MDFKSVVQEMVDWRQQFLEDVYADWDLAKYVGTSTYGDLVANATTGKPTASQVVARGGNPSDVPGGTANPDIAKYLVIVVALIALGVGGFLLIEAVK